LALPSEPPFKYFAAAFHEGVVRILFCAAVFLAITNKAYPAAIRALANTHRDGERIAGALKALGFAVAEYVERLEKAGPEAVGFFYYAGHGAASSKYGDNYLIPTDAPIASDSQLTLQAVKIGEIIDSFAATPAKTNFLVFDACRNAPMSFSVRSATSGLRAEGAGKAC
jgi:uncharacterized caspase-like protein